MSPTPGSPARSSDSGNDWLKPYDRTSRTADFHYTATSCFDDCGICIYSLFCLTCLTTKNSADLDNAPVCGLCCYPAAGLKTRRQARAQFNLREDDCNDCLITYFCPCLSETQIAREIKYQKGQEIMSNGSVVNFPIEYTTRGNDWKHGLCSCFGDCGLCFYGYFCFPCVITGNSADLDGNVNDCGCCYPASPAKNRVQAAAQFGVRTGGYCHEWLICAFCTFCSEIQIAREIKWHRMNAITDLRGGPKVQEMRVGSGGGVPSYQPPIIVATPYMNPGQVQVWNSPAQ